MPLIRDSPKITKSAIFFQTRYSDFYFTATTSSISSINMSIKNTASVDEYAAKYQCFIPRIRILTVQKFQRKLSIFIFPDIQIQIPPALRVFFNPIGVGISCCRKFFDWTIVNLCSLNQSLDCPTFLKSAISVLFALYSNPSSSSTTSSISSIKNSIKNIPLFKEHWGEKLLILFVGSESW